MNPSRNSYSFPVDSDKAYSTDLILHPCEFCNRTFIPDSLVKHRKVCYRNYLKKRKGHRGHSKSSNNRSKSRPGSSCKSQSHIPDNIRSMIMTPTKEADDPSAPFMKLNKLMRKRQERRMNWRSRHEEFINTIRYAREYAAAIKAGETPPDPPTFNSVSIEIQKNLEKCRYCLRKFNKEAYEKHIKICREHSIQCNRTKPNKAQIEAKRRMSVRLYYKPHSFRGDSPDDDCASYSSNDTDCFSLASGPSIKTALSDRSKSTQRISLSSKVGGKNESRNLSGRRVTNSSKPTSSTQNRSNSLQSRNAGVKVDKSLQSRKNKTPIPNEDTINHKNLSFNANNAGSRLAMHTDSDKKVSRRSRSRSINKCTNSKSINEKLLNIKDLLTTKAESRDSLCDDDLTRTYQNRPDPAESLREAKRVLSFLTQRSKERERLRQDYSENGDCCSNYSDAENDSYCNSKIANVPDRLPPSIKTRSKATLNEPAERSKEEIEISKISFPVKSKNPEVKDNPENNDNFEFTVDELKCIKKWENYQKHQEIQKLQQEHINVIESKDEQIIADELPINVMNSGDKADRPKKNYDKEKHPNNSPKNYESKLPILLPILDNDPEKIDLFSTNKEPKENFVWYPKSRKLPIHPDPEYASVWRQAK